MPSVVDALFVFVAVVVASIVEYKYFFPRFRADVAANRPGTHTRAYRRAILGEWLFAIFAIMIWATHARPWRALGLTMPHGWRLALSLVIVLAAAALMTLQLWSVARLSVERRIAARPKLGAVAFMMPRTRQDEWWFIALSVTAGFCEELLSRGYLPWFFAPWLGTVGGMALAVVLFGAGHAYQGRSGAIRAGIVGAVMALIVLGTGSLIPAMIFHALIDVGGGTVGYWLLRDQSPAAPPSGRVTSEERPLGTSVGHA